MVSCGSFATWSSRHEVKSWALSSRSGSFESVAGPESQLTFGRISTPSVGLKRAMSALIKLFRRGHEARLKPSSTMLIWWWRSVCDLLILRTAVEPVIRGERGQRRPIKRKNVALSTCRTCSRLCATHWASSWPNIAAGDQGRRVLLRSQAFADVCCRAKPACCRAEAARRTVFRSRA
jgi:hypothetical protein